MCYGNKVEGKLFDAPQEEPSDELKESAVRLIKAIGLPLEFVPVWFLQKHFNVSYPLAYLLRIYLQEAL